MCRGVSVCSELGREPAKWDTECPLRQPTWVEPCLNSFIRAMDCFIGGSRDECLKQLQGIEDPEKVFRNWYIEHGQVSGGHRFPFLEQARQQAPPADLDPVRNVSKALEAKILKRDHYHCRYCGCRLIDRRVMQAFVDKLASPLLTRGRTNLERHGMILATWPYIDHVLPHSLGGRTDATNLVASCYSCNFGKDRYTCEQIGITDPRQRDPIDDGWDGLVSRLSPLAGL